MDAVVAGRKNSVFGIFSFEHSGRMWHANKRACLLSACCVEDLPAWMQEKPADAAEVIAEAESEDSSDCSSSSSDENTKSVKDAGS